MVELSAGEQGLYNPKSKIIEKASLNNSNFMAWKTGKIVLKGTPIHQAFKLLSRHYKKTFVFGFTMETLPEITTVFDNQSFDAVLEELDLLLNAKNEIKNDTIVFKPY